VKKECSIKIVGCGFIGKKVGVRLSERKLAVTCFVRSEQSLAECKNYDLDVVKCDLDEKNIGLADNVLRQFEGSCIAYFAPPPKTGLQDTRMQYFVALLNNLKITPAKIVLISTTGVYGDCQGDWIDESRGVNPQADRAHRRLSAETQVQNYCDEKNIDCVVFRVPGIYSDEKLPVKRISSGEPVVRAEDSGYTNRIHADDLAAFCVEALSEKVESGVYNCCDGNPSTMNDYFMKVADALNISRPDEISLQQAKQELSAGMLSYLAESKRIKNTSLLTNFKTQFKHPNLDAGLKKVREKNA